MMSYKFQVASSKLEGRLLTFNSQLGTWNLELATCNLSVPRFEVLQCAFSKPFGTGSAQNDVSDTIKDGFHDECGVFGIYGHAEAARLAYLGLYQLQHRGQESCGIVASDGETLRSERKVTPSEATMPHDSCPRCCS